MNTAVITIKTDSQTKLQAQQLAEELGISLSGVVNALVKHFIRTRSLILIANNSELEPTPYLKQALRKSEKERQTGQYYSFNDSKGALTFLDEVSRSNLKKYKYANQS